MKPVNLLDIEEPMPPGLYYIREPFVSPRRKRLERRARIEGWLWFVLFAALCVAVTMTRGW